MQERELTTLEGSVEDIVFASDETGFTVLELNTGEELVTVVGQMVEVSEGEQLRLVGEYVSHPTYGLQFKASLCERSLPATANAIYKYLSSGAVKGIGPVIAKRMVDAFGDETLDIMSEHPERLTEIKGLTPKKIESIGQELKRVFGVRSVMMFLSRFGIVPMVAVKIWRKWGAAGVDVIKANPYVLCAYDIGLDFSEADEIARTLDFDSDDTLRIRAGIVYVLSHNLQNGHTCLPKDKLIAAAAQLLDVGSDEVESAMVLSLEENELVEEMLGDRVFLYLPELYGAERYIAGRLVMNMRLLTAPERKREGDIHKLEQRKGISYAVQQKKAITQAMVSGVFILTGGPGTGKTTTLNAIIDLFEEQGDTVALCAPTGRAAKRLTELTGREAKTIHRLLEVDFTDPGSRSMVKFKRGEKNPLKADVIIVDEMSMVDTLLFEALLRAMKLSAKLILVGDSDQLPSVGAGNVLKSLIDSDCVPYVRLDEIFRQAAQSLIVTNAHAIVRGEEPELSQRDNDFFFMESHSYTKTAQMVADLCARRLPGTYGFSPLWDIQVLVPSRKGELGTMELNRRLQETLNPPSPDKTEFVFNGITYREGDKVMQIRNNYDMVWTRDNGENGSGVYNGDIGQVVKIDRGSRMMQLRFEDRSCSYSFDGANELELAYAVTVHKSQGSEFEAVILPLMHPTRRLYFRNLFYTAVTRAKKLLIIVGPRSAVKFMVENNKKTLRYSGLKEFIQWEVEQQEG